MITRRQFSQAALAGLVAPAVTGRWAGAAPGRRRRLGVQTYSFREITKQGTAEALDVILASMKACGVDECELWSPQIELAPPAGRDASASVQATARDALRAWRLATGAGYFQGVRKRFADAGMTVYAYNLSFNDSFTDDEITRGFEAAKALGAEVITASTTLRMAKRLVPFAEKHGVPVAMHNHSNLTDPNEFATPASFTAALAMSPLFRINLDIGHFTAANFDPLAFLQQHQDRITNLHLKDRRKNQGDNVPWGAGDTPIRPVLAWLKQHKSPVRAYVEYEYPGHPRGRGRGDGLRRLRQAGADVVNAPPGHGPGRPGIRRRPSYRRGAPARLRGRGGRLPPAPALRPRPRRGALGVAKAYGDLRRAGGRPRRRRGARDHAQRAARPGDRRGAGARASTWCATSRWPRPRRKRAGCATPPRRLASCTR